MTDLRSSAQHLVAAPPTEPPTLSDLRARVNRRRRRGRAACAAVAALVVIGGVVAFVAVPRDGDGAYQRTIAGPSTTIQPPSGPPPPAVERDVTLAVIPDAIPPDGAEVRVELRNASAGTVQFPRPCAGLRLDRWDGSGWRPIDLRDPGSQGPGPCPGITLPAGSVAPIRMGPLKLDPGWYRYVTDATPVRLPFVGFDGPLAEGRFTVEGSGRPPEPLAGSRTVWLRKGESLQRLAPSAVQEAVVIDDHQLFLSWTSACNGPGAAVTFDLEANRVVVRLVVGYFTVIDCTGDPPGSWSAVVDLPEPLGTRELVVTGPSSAEQSVRRLRSDRRIVLLDEPGPVAEPVSLRPTLVDATEPRPTLRLSWWGSDGCDFVGRAELLVVGKRGFLVVQATTTPRCPLSTRFRDVPLPPEASSVDIFGTP